MSQSYARLLQDQDQVEHFLTVVLDHDFSGLKNIYYDIVAGEKGLIDISLNSQTLSNTKYRDRDFKDDKVRWLLRKQIIEELLTMERPDNDDTIKLGFGGSLPQSGVHTEKQAYILIGLPASGKSGIANKISEDRHAIVIDSDYVKRKLPEYANYTWGATIVHEESSQMAMGFKDNPEALVSLYQASLEQGFNVVIPKIGQDARGIINLAQLLKKVGYSIHLTLVSLLKREATIRAIYRFHETKRYVPLGLIFDVYGNDPILNYYLIKDRKRELFSSFGAIYTNVPQGNPLIAIDRTENNPANLYTFQENLLI